MDGIMPLESKNHFALSITRRYGVGREFVEGVYGCWYYNPRRGKKKKKKRRKTRSLR